MRDFIHSPEQPQATLSDPWEADVVVVVSVPSDEAIGRLAFQATVARDRAALIGAQELRRF